MCAVTLNGVPVMMESDTGATTSIISSRQFEQSRQGSQQLQLTTENLPTLRTYSGHMIQPAGGVTVDVRHQEQSYTLPCLVVTGYGPNLLGRDWLEHMKLDWSAVHRVDEVHYALMFPELFKDGLGKLKNVEAKLYVDSEAMPSCFKPCTVPLALRGKVDKVLDRLQAQGVIIPVELSDWAAPIVPVLKANGEVRICGYYKLTANTAAKTDQYLIPNIEDLYSKLACDVVYSGASGIFQRGMEQIVQTDDGRLPR